MENTAADQKGDPSHTADERQPVPDQAPAPDDATARRLGYLPGGVAPGSSGEEPAGVPHTGRHQTETAVTPD